MENTNKLGLKKYILLADGRVIESNKLKDIWNWYDDICLVDEDVVYDANGLDKTKKYIEEVIPNWREGEADDGKYTEIIATSDYLYKFNTKNELGLSIVIKQPNGKYEFMTDFNPDNEVYIIYIAKEGFACLLGSDEEVLLGSWYEGGMRFVAQWDREKKDWVLI